MFNAVKAHVAGHRSLLRRGGGGRLHAGADVQPQAQEVRRADGAASSSPPRTSSRTSRRCPAAPFCVGFAAESENLADYAQAKRVKKKIPMIVANLVQHTIGKEENEVTIYDDAGAHSLARAPKSKIAHGILAHAPRCSRRSRRAPPSPPSSRFPDDPARREDPRREDPRPTARLRDARLRGPRHPRLHRRAASRSRPGDCRADPLGPRDPPRRPGARGDPDPALRAWATSTASCSATSWA